MAAEKYVRCLHGTCAARWFRSCIQPPIEKFIPHNLRSLEAASEAASQVALAQHLG